MVEEEPTLRSITSGLHLGQHPRQTARDKLSEVGFSTPDTRQIGLQMRSSAPSRAIEECRLRSLAGTVGRWGRPLGANVVIVPYGGRPEQ